MSIFKENVGSQNVAAKWRKAMDSSNHGCSDFMKSIFLCPDVKENGDI